MRELGLRAVFALSLILMGCDGAPPAPAPTSETVELPPIGPNMTIAAWQTASPQMQATYFRGAVSTFITDPARNDAQRHFDDDLALDLRDCVNAEIVKDEPSAETSVRPFLTRCLEASGFPAPG